jgi:hypothetical protein
MLIECPAGQWPGFSLAARQTPHSARSDTALSMWTYLAHATRIKSPTRAPKPEALFDPVQSCTGEQIHPYGGYQIRMC